MTYIKIRMSHEFDVWAAKRPLLRHLDVELTERCNNDCIHCCINLPDGSVAARDREMSTEFIKDVLMQAAELGCLTVRFTGGEPLLRDDFSELYLFARRLGMHVLLFTNGRLITPELAELFAKFPPGRDIEISVYGMTPDSYERVAGQKGAFSEFRRGLALLSQFKIPLVIKWPILDTLMGELEEFEAWAMTINSMDKAPSYSRYLDLRSRRDSPQKNLLIQKLRQTPEQVVTLLSRQSSSLNELRQLCEMFLGPPGDRLFTCGAGHGTGVDAYGKAQPCLALRDPGTAVDLEKIPLKTALEEIFSVTREVRATNPEYLRRCARCFLKALCEQCPAKSWVENETLDTPVEYLCEVAHAQARHFGLIHLDENAWDVLDWRVRVRRLAENHASEAPAQLKSLKGTDE